CFRRSALPGILSRVARLRFAETTAWRPTELRLSFLAPRFTRARRAITQVRATLLSGRREDCSATLDQSFPLWPPHRLRVRYASHLHSAPVLSVCWTRIYSF